MEFKDNEIEEILQKKAKPIGSGAYVTVPKRHLGKKCVVVILKSGFFND